MLKIKVSVTLDVFHDINERISKILPSEFQNVKGKIQLSIEELMVNIFHYAHNKDHAIGEVEITFDIKDYNNIACAYISIQDFGPAFNPFDGTAPTSLEKNTMERPIGGLGLHLVKSLTTHFNYKYINNSNFVVLYFAP